jgi:3',5'-cyclic AMP phosphodiesterase CpdA
MPARFLHVSDLHVGGHDEGRVAVEAAVRELVARERPELVVASGDLSHRNQPDQHARAAAFLRSLGPPVLALPGNHDLPSLPPARLLRPFAHFEREWERCEAEYRSDELVVCGLNSTRPWKYQRGALRESQLERVQAMFGAAPLGTLRVVALHHHLASPPWRFGKRTIPRRSRVLEALAGAGAELVLSGHIHQSLVVSRREFLLRHDAGNPVLAVAPGLGRPRPTRHAEARGFHMFEAEARSFRVVTYAWDAAGLGVVAEREFPRGAIA